MLPPEDPPGMPPLLLPPGIPPDEPPDMPPPPVPNWTAQPLMTKATAAAIRVLRTVGSFRFVRQRDFIALSPHQIQCTIAVCAGSGLHADTDFNNSWRPAS
jgi:hypothetical protein